MATLKEIRKDLQRREVENHAHRHFIPYAQLKTVLTRLVIQELLQASGIEFYDVAELTKAISRGGLRLLGILVYIDAVSAAKTFRELDHSFARDLDSRLPLQRSDLQAIGLDEDQKDRFVKDQWVFLAPVLRQGEPLRRLHPSAILPFLTSEPVSKGGFGEVTKVSVDVTHHHISSPPGETRLVLVRKVLIEKREGSALDRDFAHELNILSCLRCLSHPNIIRLITAFTLGDCHNFLFPQASGDLHDLLSSPDGMIGLQTNHDIIRSLWSLSSALAAVHEYFAEDFGVHRIGCHYDIKPRNILCMDGRLILSDFGLSRLAEENEGSRTLFKQGEGFYLAPECQPSDHDFEPGKIGRASDIWSLGCVLSELLAYVDSKPGERPSNVERYRKSRRIRLSQVAGNYFHSDDDVNPAVTTFLQSFEGRTTNLLAPKLLAKAIRKMLQFAPEDRPDASSTTQALFAITLKEKYHQILSAVELNDDAELAVEIKVLTLWADAAGLVPHPQSKETLWLQQPHKYLELKAVEDLLERFSNEVLLLQSHERLLPEPDFSVYHNLRRLGERLVDILPRSSRDSVTTGVEDFILTTMPKTASYSAHAKRPTLVESVVSIRRVALLETTRKIAQAESGILENQLLYDPNSLTRPFQKMSLHYLTRASPSRDVVLIERLEYEADWNNRVEELQKRVRTVACMRNHSAPTEIFPILPCLGYYHSLNPPAFDLVYGLPPLAVNTRPFTLLEIIKQTSSRSEQPTLSQKFKLARLLVEFVSTLHRGDWVHKNICGMNIIFFPWTFASSHAATAAYATLDAPDTVNAILPSATAAAASLSEPFFIGLSQGREALFSAFSHGPKEDERRLKEYQHPVYLRGARVLTAASTATEARTAETTPTLSITTLDHPPPFSRFRLEFDHYSTGLVLLEIALWKPLSKITQSIVGSPEVVQETFLKRHVPLVRSYMGDIYADALEACLKMYRGDEGSVSQGVTGTRRCTPEEIRAEFSNKVVEALAQCVV